MKRQLKNEDVLDISILVNFMELQDVAATTIKPIPVDKEKDEVDGIALGEYQIFVEQVYEILEYYDFKSVGEFKESSGSFPYTSRYKWIAHDSEIEANSVPKFIRLRISDHIQEFSKEGERRINSINREQVDKIKIPHSKKRQRYEVVNIVVNNETYDTYEQALHAVELMIHDWLKNRGIDVTEYEPLGW